MQLALVGAALVAFVTPLTTLVLLRDQATFNSYRFWVVGALTGRDLGVLAWLLPFLLVGLLLAAYLAHRLNGLALGDDIARGLGQDVRTTRILAGLAIVLLCGTAVSLAGPIALVGLVVPHAARRLVGVDHHATTALAVLLGPIMLLGRT
ncbi:iron chelate uptake ABC transporter family permease subunit [Tessaracoccus coleopterorum]|uniref:iron chelate uptake ABC transporter family permease subunit n=1 Tax=Tessaracoccus coleopterorum TaxID=2714950 RepID=UPI002F908ABB